MSDLLLHRILRIGVIAFGAPLFVVCYPCNVGAVTDPCPVQQQATGLLRARIKADQKAIRDLRVGITDRDLEDANDLSENGRKSAMLAAALSLLDGFLSAPEAALGTKNIAGIELKNGLGSIGTGQANALIGRIRTQGGAKTALVPLLRKLSQISAKTSKLEYLDALSKAASMLKSVAEMGADENSLDEAEAFFALATAMVGPVALADSLVNAVLNSARNETQIYLLAKDINQLTNTAEAQLKALKVLSAKLQTDVQTLLLLSAVDVCATDVSWQIKLQQQRIAAAATGNIDFYNQLLRLHGQIFKQLGLKACESGFYPGGCTPTPGATIQRPQVVGTICPPFSARNAQDALQVENSSHKDVCWRYNGKTLIATSDEAPDKANKPYPTGAHPSEGGIAERAESEDRGTKKDDASLPLGFKVNYIRGNGDLDVVVPRFIQTASTSPRVAVYQSCNTTEYSSTENRNELDHRQSGTFGLPGLPVKKFGAGTTINLEPGEYCILLNFTSFTHYPTYVDRDYAYMSGTGFRPLPVTVKPGYTARVAVPMGLLDVKLVPSSPYGISCTFTDAAGHYLPYIREFGESGQKVAMPPGDYNYVCGNRSKDPAQSTLVLQRGSFKIVEAHVATVKLTPRNGSNPDDYR